MDRYAVIGNPIGHSLSPFIHARFATQTGEDMRYEALLAPRDGFRAAVDTFIAEGGRGMNVTLPFKGEARELADKLSERARRAQAVNTLTFEAGRIRGDNTDGIGLLRDLHENHEFPLAGKTVLILGAGGAVRGVLGPLLDATPHSILLANRTLSRAEALTRSFACAGTLTACTLDGIPARPVDVIINAISAGLEGETFTPPATTIGPGTCCYDMLYARGRTTPFVRWARGHGAARVADGLGMLVEQAAESFLIWRGVRPDTAPVLEVLRGDTPI